MKTEKLQFYKKITCMGRTDIGYKAENEAS